MDQPRWLACAWAELGQREVGGTADNARIRAFFGDVGQPPSLHDEVAWCAAFVGACLERAGLASTRSLMARSYARWGEALSESRLGAIAVLSRGSDPDAGHVGFLLAETDDSVVLLGGNQGDAVTVAAFPKSRVIALRWPIAARAADARVSDPPPQAEAARIIAAAVFEPALAHVLEMEGGYSDDPYDPGGPTNLGVTLKVFADWKGVALDAGSCAPLREELKSIPMAAVREIYATRYWVPARCDELAAALAFFHFDAAVNHGVTGATRLLQRAVGTDVDGEVGPLTRAAIARLPIDAMLDAYAECRRRRYRALPHFWRFGRGWLARVDATLSGAHALAAETTAAPQSSTPTTQQKGPTDMATSKTSTPEAKWWGSSITIWGAIITGLSTVLPALGPAFGIDITGDLVREVGEGVVQTVQAVGGLIGTLMTIYGRVRASQPLEQRSMSLKL